MKTAYIANVGTRDLQLNNEPLKEPRRLGAELLRDYETVRSKLFAPILLPGIEHVLKETGRIDRVLLFATDQPLMEDEKYRRLDTIECGRVLEKFLKERLAEKVGDVICRPIPHNPADYNRSLVFYEQQLPELAPSEEFDTVWVAPIGGADASNVGLTLNATRLYRERCQFIYVFPNQEVQTLNLHRVILDGYAREQIRLLLEKRDFSALKSVLEQSQLGGKWHIFLCDYADRRAHFDFEGARAALDMARQVARGADELSKVERCRRTLEPLLNPLSQPNSSSSIEEWEKWLALQQARLAELYFNLKLKADRGEWVDFLGRLFRLREAVLRFIFEGETRHSTEKAGKEPRRKNAPELGDNSTTEFTNNFPDFAKAVLADPTMADHFRSQKLSLDVPDNRNLMAFLVRHISGKLARYQEAHNALRKFEALGELRNKSILAHGYEGIDKGKLEKVLKQIPTETFVKQHLGSLLSCLGATVSDESDPLMPIVTWLREV